MAEYENIKIKTYADEMPAELRRVIDALNSDIGLAAFFVMFKYGEMSFSQIMTELDIPPNYSSKLVYHIKKLQKSSLIKNEYIKKENVGGHSFYDITEFGEGIISNLMNSIQAPQSNNSFIQLNQEIRGWTSNNLMSSIQASQSNNSFIQSCEKSTIGSNLRIVLKSESSDGCITEDSKVTCGSARKKLLEPVYA